MPTISEAFGIAGNLFGIIKRLAGTPGINLIPVVAQAGAILSVLEVAAGAGHDISEAAEKIQAARNKPEVSLEDWASLKASIETWRVEARAPLPPKEEGEEEG